MRAAATDLTIQPTLPPSSSCNEELPSLNGMLGKMAVIFTFHIGIIQADSDTSPCPKSKDRVKLGLLFENGCNPVSKESGLHPSTTALSTMPMSTAATDLTIQPTLPPASSYNEDLPSLYGMLGKMTVIFAFHVGIIQADSDTSPCPKSKDRAKLGPLFENACSSVSVLHHSTTTLPTIPTRAVATDLTIQSTLPPANTSNEDLPSLHGMLGKMNVVFVACSCVASFQISDISQDIVAVL